MTAPSDDRRIAEMRERLAAAKVCHDEQMIVWSSQIVSSLAMRGYLRDNFCYDEMLDVHEAISHEIRAIVKSAFSHTELASPAGRAALALPIRDAPDARGEGGDDA